MHSQLEDQLINQPISPSLEMVDKIYHRAYQYFTLCNAFTSVYALLRIIISPIFIFFTNQQSQLKIWLIGLFIISVIQLIHYRKIDSKSKKIYCYLSIAKKLNHLNYFPRTLQNNKLEHIQYRIHEINDFNNPQQQLDDKKIKMLSLEIKYQMQDQSTLAYYIGKIQFICYQSLHIWGFIIFFNNNEISSFSNKYLVIILFLSTYQYLQFYILLLMIIIAAPFYLITKIIQSIIIKNNTYKILKSLKQTIYHKKILGDHQCKICLNQYYQGQSIIILKCSNYHHYHSNCLKGWIVISTTCPMCRQNILTNH